MYVPGLFNSCSHIQTRFARWSKSKWMILKYKKQLYGLTFWKKNKIKPPVTNEERDKDTCCTIPTLILRRTYTTVISGMVLLIFGTRADNIAHGPLEFRRANARNLRRRRAEITSGDRLRLPKMWHACQTNWLLSQWLTTTGKALGSKMRSCFSRRKKNGGENHGKTHSNSNAGMLIDL